VNRHFKLTGTNLKRYLVKLQETDHEKVLHLMLFYLYLNGEEFIEFWSSALEFQEQSFLDSFDIFAKLCHHFVFSINLDFMMLQFVLISDRDCL
jgi:hypothetical protein